MMNVRDLGAVGDGGTLTQDAFQAAIDQCHAQGGGRVTVPAGGYLCAGVVLKSGVELHLERNATILGSLVAEDYAHVQERLGESARVSGLANENGGAVILADGARDISITGLGKIDGQAHGPAPRDPRPDFRGKSVHFRNCENVLVEGVTLQYADSWCLHLERCERVFVRGVTIFNDIARINSDGIDPDSCTDVIISDCHIVAGDDCIVIKALKDLPAEYITVTNCVLETSCAGLKLGTESVGDIRHVTFSNCVIKGCRAGIALYPELFTVWFGTVPDL